MQAWKRQFICIGLIISTMFTNQKFQILQMTATKKRFKENCLGDSVPIFKSCKIFSYIIILQKLIKQNKNWWYKSQLKTSNKWTWQDFNIIIYITNLKYCCMFMYWNMIRKYITKNKPMCFHNMNKQFMVK